MNIKLQQLGNKGAYINTEQSCIIQNDFFLLQQLRFCNTS